MTKQRTYGFDAVKLAEHLTIEELVALDQSIRADHEVGAQHHPKNRTDSKYWGGSSNTIWLYTKSARKKLDAESGGYAIRFLGPFITNNKRRSHVNCIIVTRSPPHAWRPSPPAQTGDVTAPITPARVAPMPTPWVGYTHP